MLSSIFLTPSKKTIQEMNEATYAAPVQSANSATLQRALQRKILLGSFRQKMLPGVNLLLVISFILISSFLLAGSYLLIR